MKGERISAARATTLECRARDSLVRNSCVAVDPMELLVLLSSEEAGWGRAGHWRGAARQRLLFRNLAIAGWALAALLGAGLAAAIYVAPPAHWPLILQQWSGL